MRSFLCLVMIIIVSCNDVNHEKQEKGVAIMGTWELISATTIIGDSIVEKDLEGKKMIKIINGSHFSFHNHDIKDNKDSLNYYVSGGGEYRLSGDQYIESLEYCSSRQWEGNEFEFNVKVVGDTLIQKGVEKIEELNVDREIIEVYLKSKKQILN